MAKFYTHTYSFALGAPIIARAQSAPPRLPRTNSYKNHLFIHSFAFRVMRFAAGLNEIRGEQNERQVRPRTDYERPTNGRT